MEWENGVWFFKIKVQSVLTTSGPWRIVVDDRIAIADCDHGHKFGLPQPFDSIGASKQTLVTKAIQGVKIRQDTGDLTLLFGNAALEVLNPSSGYEGWNLQVAGVNVIALGGGELCVLGQLNAKE